MPRIVALSGSAGLILSGGAGGLTGKQRRQLRSEAGRQEASKTLRRIICAGTEASEVARSAPELDTQLSSGELVRIKFSQVRPAQPRSHRRRLSTSSAARPTQVEHKREVPALANELARLVSPPAEVAQVRLLARVAPLRARCGPRPHRVPARHRCSGTRPSSTGARSTG